MNNMTFNNEVQLAEFLGRVDIIPEAYRAILETNFAYELHTSCSGINILAFNCSPEYTNRFVEGEFDLVPSRNLHLVHFISTKLNSSFSINEAAIELFQNLNEDIKELENERIKTSLIITGSGVGGYLAILSALRLHHSMDMRESYGSKIINRPICITFGSPLIGDAALQHAIDERPRWRSNFLHVVAIKDPVASFFSSNAPYKPLGTFLFCTESGGHATFKDQDVVMHVLDIMKLSNASNLQNYDYTNILSLMRKKVLYRGVSELGEFNLNPLNSGIALQFREIGVLVDISNDQIWKMEKEHINKLNRKKANNTYQDPKRLNNTKIWMSYMEWYIKTRRIGGGYYDNYKNSKFREDTLAEREIEITLGHLNHYWKRVVKENDLMPQKEGAKLRYDWLSNGTTYRRIIEPLDIAKYYTMGKVNYIENRPNHYKLLEKWFNEEKNAESTEVPRYKGTSLTLDSCFWAHVEEALILLSDLENGWSNNIEKGLEQFEVYVMRAITSYSLSLDIFLTGSSFMEWWKKYKSYKGTSYASDLAEYMNSGSYQLYRG